MTVERARTSVAAGACLTFGVAFALAVGAIPQIGSDASHVAHVVAGTAATTPNAPTTAPAVNRVVAPTAHSGSGAATGTTGAAVVTLSVASTGGSSTFTATDVAQTQQVARHHRRHHHRRHHHRRRPAPTVTATPTPTKAARTTPSAAQVSAALAGLRQYVHSPFTPSSSEVAQFGNYVCTAFDDGKTYAQVITAVDQKVNQIPFTTVEPGGDDYVVHTAVSLYCPGYSSKLG